MPKREPVVDKPAEGAPKRQATLNVIVHPEETVATPLNPAYISLGLSSERFKKNVGGTAAD